MNIQLLPPDVAEKIAAGEVIERPASVVKELVENALDAGATEISVRLEDGGRSLIEVTDNGRGMGPDDLKIAALRHATSKIRNFEDLESLHTLGFRGEALPSIAAVSDLRILSRSEDSDQSFVFEPHPNSATPVPEPVTFGHFLGSKAGTQITVTGLFSQIPARLKFLKTPRAEVALVREWLERLALAHPEAGFTLTHDGRQLMRLKAEEERARVLAILGEGEDFPIIQERAQGARLYWLQGLSTPQTRKLIQVVNGRVLKDKLIQSALLSPFKQVFLPGQFPALVIYLSVPPNELDVNVHPSKTEVRFLKSSEIFRRIQELGQKLIDHHGASGFVPATLHEELPPIESLTQNLSVELESQESVAVGSSSSQFSDSELFTLDRRPSLDIATLKIPPPLKGFDFREFISASILSKPASPLIAEPSQPFLRAEYLGTIFNTYLLLDLGTELGLVDQHAAHERIRYERLKKKILVEGRMPESQQLLIPETVTVDLEAMPELVTKLKLIEKLGFEVEAFSDKHLLFRSVPSIWGMTDLKARLKGLVERVLALAPGSEKATLIDEPIFEALASEACHSSVRAGDRVPREQALSLLRDLFSCEHPWNCPHGRPTTARIPKAKFEEWFGRRA